MNLVAMRSQMHILTRILERCFLVSFSSKTAGCDWDAHNPLLRTSRGMSTHTETCRKSDGTDVKIEPSPDVAGTRVEILRIVLDAARSKGTKPWFILRMAIDTGLRGKMRLPRQKLVLLDQARMALTYAGIAVTAVKS